MALVIAFAIKSHRQLCENEAIAERKFGLVIAKKLKQRLADLRAATNVKDIPVGRPRELDGIYQHQFAVDICEGYCLIFCANHNSNPVLESGEINWAQVTRIKILRIETHD